MAVAGAGDKGILVRQQWDATTLVQFTQFISNRTLLQEMPRHVSDSELYEASLVVANDEFRFLVVGQTHKSGVESVAVLLEQAACNSASDRRPSTFGNRPTEPVVGYSDINGIGGELISIIKNRRFAETPASEESVGVGSLKGNMYVSKLGEMLTSKPVKLSSWGGCTFILDDDHLQLARIFATPGKKLPVQNHHCCSEQWIVVRDAAKVTLDETVEIQRRN
jgi:hypothetical protein